LADHDRGGAILVIENDVPGVGLDLNLLLLRHPLLPPRTGWTHPAPIQRRGHIRTGSSCRQRSRGAPRNDPAPASRVRRCRGPEAAPVAAAHLLPTHSTVVAHHRS